jgi:hypothetical protein
MSYDIGRATNAAFHAVAEVARVLRDAIQKRQEFTVDVEAGEGADDRLDGSCTIHVSVQPHTRSEPAVLDPA